MSDNQAERPLARLRDIAVRQRQAAEQAEAWAEEIASVTQALGAFVSSRTFLGGFRSRPYSEESRRTDSGFVSQAALNIPRGLGVIGCDTEEYDDLRDRDELHENFRPFQDCDMAERAFLNSEVPSLIEQLEEYVVRELPAG